MRTFVPTALLACLLVLAVGATPMAAQGAAPPRAFVETIISPADDELAKRVDEIFAAWDSTRSPGVALGVIDHGKLVYARGYGMANLEHGVPITPTTVFRIGSTSKQFTAACIAILALEGEISLEDDIREYLPEMPEYPRPVTVEHLVHHTSGLRDYLTLEFAVRGLRADDYYTPQDSLALLTQQRELNFLPGDEHLYSNSGYLLMGMIVERVTGQTLAEFAQRRIFEPLGMDNSHFHDDHTLPVRNRADGYAATEDGFRVANTTLDHVGDGGVFTTIEDLVSWDQAFYSNTLGAELMKLMHQTGSLTDGEQLEYAFGLSVSERRGLPMVRHAGGFVGFRADMVRYPTEEFSVICLANLGSINPSGLCDEVADLYLADRFGDDASATMASDTVDGLVPVTLPLSALQSKAGTWLHEASGMQLETAVLEGRLELTAEVLGGAISLTPVGTARFVGDLDGQRLSATFAPDDATAQRATIAIRGVANLDLIRLPDLPAMSAAARGAYSGRYWSDEVEVAYEVTARGDGVWLRVAGRPAEMMQRLGPDKFSVASGTVEFLRQDGLVTEFRLNAGRVRIRFIKQPDAD
ncbi:MAG TPA: serine hydrolase domain-containing protein [Acidobacteriota bacterium]|nr:serine hydrolase domain-containing protein [Acidobacteriota bacterium]